jgi:hypothetical protein
MADGSAPLPRATWHWRAWTEAEHERLRDAYARGGIREAMLACPDRSKGSISVQAARLGLHSARSWTAEDIRRLRELYPLLGPTGLAPMFPQRTYSSLAQKAEKLGLRHEAYWWSDADREAVTKAYATGGLAAVRALGLRRSERAAMQMAGLPSARSWTADELRTLRQVWQTKGRDAACAALPHRTRVAVIGQARRFKLHQHGTCRHWDATDKRMLRQLYPKLGKQATAELMSWRTPRAIYHKAKALGLKAPSKKSVAENMQPLGEGSAQLGTAHGVPIAGDLVRGFAHQVAIPVSELRLAGSEVLIDEPMKRLEIREVEIVRHSSPSRLFWTSIAEGQRE